MEHLTMESCADVSEAIAGLTAARKWARGGWYTAIITIEGREFQFKCHGTWVQIARCPEYQDSGPMDCSVARWREFLTKFMGG